jgi:hypothetical protein
MTTEMREQTFGIEIETVNLPREAAARAVQGVVGGSVRHAGGTYDAWVCRAADGREWKAVKDASLAGSCGAEIVSPICRYADIDTVQAIVRAVKAAGAKVNGSCGIHVHVGLQGATAKELVNLVKVVDHQEEYMFRAFGVLEHRRARYCRPVERSLADRIRDRRPESLLDFKRAWYNNYAAPASSLELWTPPHYHDSRYHGFNLHALFTKGTVEYRYFNGSLHPGKIKAYIQFCMALTARGRNSRGARGGRRQFRAESSKYDFRCFLLSLNLIGDEFKVCRLHMLARLSGDSAYQNGRPAVAMAA